MSGHSKWSTIKREKAATDQARGQIFTKLGAAITISVREGGGPDIQSNFRLRLAVEKARAANMPKDNIDRAIERALGKSEGVEFTNVLYEIFAPGGVAVLAEGVTDNKQRTSAEIKNILHINGGTLGAVGSVSYLFTKVGEIQVAKTDDFDSMLSVVLDVAGDDLEEESDRFLVYTKPIDLHAVTTKLKESGKKTLESSLIYKPMSSITLDQNTSQKVMPLLTALDAQSDIHKVFTNAELTS